MIAFVRDVPDSFDQALSTTGQAIDVAAARRQHAGYVQALSWLGVEVRRLKADAALPDCCFVEDTAVVAGRRALVTRPGAVSRLDEIDETRRALVGLGGLDVHMTEPPATIDGGDCMRVGRWIYVGRSARTNELGVARLAAVHHGYEVVPVDLPADVLHLKCVVSPLGGARVLLARDTLDPKLFAGCEIVWVPTAESYAANVVALGGAAICASGFPRTQAALVEAGFRVTPIDTSEFRKADGALTCLSILVDEG